MSVVGTMLASVVATSIALLVARSSQWSAKFRHSLLFVAVVVVPAGALIIELLPQQAADSVLLLEFGSAIDSLKIRQLTEPVRLVADGLASQTVLLQIYFAVLLVLLVRVFADVVRTSLQVANASQVKRLRLFRRGFRVVSVRQSQWAKSPLTWGLFRPLVVVPEN